MDIESLRRFCLSLPHVTEGVQWDNDLLFRVGGKMFAVASLDITPTRVSFKCTPEKFAELIEREDITPAAYMARIHWVTLHRLDALEEAETESLIRESYEMVWAKLTKKLRAELEAGVN
ncbi:MAG TPA: MmcQ/YjbR family DNA-binding protein [Pyrinomonadaceae bacterium]|nr:MmcQ/YjbR family DNA-binding protein [Pyrinomonadaceae bacterium]